LTFLKIRRLHKVMGEAGELLFSIPAQPKPQSLTCALMCVK
jgi:hypothetical protein